MLEEDMRIVLKIKSSKEYFWKDELFIMFDWCGTQYQSFWKLKFTQIVGFFF